MVDDDGDGGGGRRPEFDGGCR
ncbi:hypothetical protein Tco_0495366, partial [Tanacetum coccineum]